MRKRLAILCAAFLAPLLFGGCGLLVDAAVAGGGLPSNPHLGRTWNSQARLLEAGYSLCPSCRGSGECRACESWLLSFRPRSSCRACGGSRRCPTCGGGGVVE